MTLNERSMQEMYTRLLNGQMNDTEIRKLAECPHAKEGLISFIQSKSEADKKIILDKIFTPTLKLYVFFITPRTWSERILGRSGLELFDILLKMKEVVSQRLLEQKDGAAPLI